MAEDHRTIFFAIKKASINSGHDQAVGKRYVPPTKDTMKQDLTELKEYIAKLKKQCNEVEKRRKDIDKPPIAQVSSPPVN